MDFNWLRIEADAGRLSGFSSQQLSEAVRVCNRHAIGAGGPTAVIISSVHKELDKEISRRESEAATLRAENLAKAMHEETKAMASEALEESRKANEISSGSRVVSDKSLAVSKWSLWFAIAAFMAALLIPAAQWYASKPTKQPKSAEPEPSIESKIGSSSLPTNGASTEPPKLQLLPQSPRPLPTNSRAQEESAQKP